MKLKEIYQYFYYKLYKLFEDWWSEWKAILSLCVLKCFIIISVAVYYEVITKKNAIIFTSKLSISLVAIIIFLVNYFIFMYKDKWRVIINKFDNLPKRTNSIGDWIVYCIVILIIVNLIFAFYLMSQIDWKQYR